MIKDIEGKARAMLWRIFAPFRMDKPRTEYLFEWYPGIHFDAELKKAEENACQLIVRKIDENKPQNERVVWEESGIIYFTCFTSQPVRRDVDTAVAFNLDAFYLTSSIRNMIAKHEGTE